MELIQISEHYYHLVHAWQLEVAESVRTSHKQSLKEAIQSQVQRRHRIGAGNGELFSSGLWDMGTLIF